MKKHLTFSLALSLTVALSAQSIQELATGAGYQKQSFVNLATGTEKQVNNTAWDIAFTVFGQQDAGIFVNESAGSSMGAALPATELYYALTDNFDEVIDPASLTDFQLFNSERSWNYGAFNEVRDSLNAFDFGWGQYNFQTNQVNGNAVYVVKLRNGQYRKLKIESLIGGTYTFKYANPDGTNLQTKTINKADHAGKTLAYFSFDTGATVDVEPAGGFDLLYCRYTTRLYDPGSMTTITYNVTGILHGRGAEVAEADGINPATVAYADYQDSLHSELDVIGHDWKAFSGTAWSVDADRVFFLRTAESRVWKLQFIDFEGSSTGKTILDKTDLGIITAVQDPAAVGLKALMYPNPVQDQLRVVLDVPTTLAKDAQLEVMDLQGRLVSRQTVRLQAGFQAIEMSEANWSTGMLVLLLILPNQEIQLGKIIK
ncbi:MAG: T9SS type A sorting domain-containing protein, partial [Saprospiraceae bacterium]|nr:T9SS type A sorting domain-containing protein [Saprospiraceae bacterium]